MERLPLVPQTLYAELLEQLLAFEAQRSIGHNPGCFTAKAIRGKTYHYFQYSDPGGVSRQVYVGRQSPELDRVIARFQEQKEMLREDVAGIQRLCAQLRAGGALVTDTASARVLKSLADSGVFHLDGVLLGTQAFTVLGNLLGVRWTGSAIRTLDIDIGGERRMSIAVPGAQADIPKALESLEMGFVPVPSPNRKAPSTSFKVRGKALRVDLLTNQIPGREDQPVLIPRFKASAEPVPLLDYLMESPVPGAVIDGGGVLVKVPQPGRFAFHKLIASQGRGVVFHGKVAKDLAQAAQAIAVLLEDRPGDLVAAWDELGRRGERWVKRAAAGLKKLSAEHPALCGQAGELLRLER